MSLASNKAYLDFIFLKDSVRSNRINVSEIFSVNVPQVMEEIRSIFL